MTGPIGLFDSGFGGLTVLRELVAQLPNEDFIYLGDTAHLPYGNKSPEAICEFAEQNASFLIDQGIKLLVVACHTASCHALSFLQAKLPIPVMGMIEPGLVLMEKFSRTALLGTASTVASAHYSQIIQKRLPRMQLFSQACPLFVPLVEEGLHLHPAAYLIAETYLAPFKDRIEAALLACTHYPLLRPVLQQVLGRNVTLLEPAPICALQVKNALLAKGLLNLQKRRGKCQFYATDDSEKFQTQGKIFWEGELSCMRVSLEQKARL